MVPTRVMPAIETHQLCRGYGSRVGIDQLDLRIASGELFGFLGPNGSGKTTTIRLLLGFLRPSSGTAIVFGHDCWRNSPAVKQEVGYLPGDVRLYRWLTARRGLQLSSRIRGKDVRRHGMQLVERLGLEPDVPVRKMSRGMRQKLGLILALAHEPSLLVLDEPTGGLDPLVQLELIEYLREVTRAGRTVFFSSHTLSEVEQLCDRVAIVRQGTLVVDASMESLRKTAQRSAVISFADAAMAQDLAVPDWLQRDRIDERSWYARLDGEATELIRWAAAHQVVDLQLGPPDLESLFRSYFRSERKGV